MIKEVIGAVSTALVLLPFHFLNRIVFRQQNHNRYAFLFLLVNVPQVAALVLMAYSLYFVGQRTLTGWLISFIVFFFLFLFRWISSRKPLELPVAVSENMEFETQPLSRKALKRQQDTLIPHKRPTHHEADLPEDKILEEDAVTAILKVPDFSRVDKKEIKKTLEDIFKEDR